MRLLEPHMIHSITRPWPHLTISQSNAPLFLLMPVKRLEDKQVLSYSEATGTSNNQLHSKTLATSQQLSV